MVQAAGGSSVTEAATSHPSGHVACPDEPSAWSLLPPELLADIISRLERDNAEWPERRSLVACAGVCTTWRSIARYGRGAPFPPGHSPHPLQTVMQDLAQHCLLCYLLLSVINLCPLACRPLSSFHPVTCCAPLLSLGTPSLSGHPLSLWAPPLLLGL